MLKSELVGFVGVFTWFCLGWSLLCFSGLSCTVFIGILSMGYITLDVPSLFDIYDKFIFSRKKRADDE